jgi:hypothetical protein
LLREFAIVGCCVHTALLIAVQAGALTRLSATDAWGRAAAGDGS